MAKIEIDTVRGTIREKVEGNSKGSLFVLLLVIFFIIIDIYEKAPQKDANNFNEYCSTQQLPKTGYKMCDDAREKLLKRYKQELVDTQKDLQKKQAETESLISQQKQKCTTENIQRNGKNACDNAVKNIVDHEKNIEKTKDKINDYEQKIQKLNNFKIDGTHIVSTDALNFRSCPKTECSIIGKLKNGDVVVMQEDLGEWLKISVKNKTGYATKKFLWDSRRTTDVKLEHSKN